MRKFSLSFICFGRAGRFGRTTLRSSSKAIRTRAGEENRVGLIRADRSVNSWPGFAPTGQILQSPSLGGDCPITSSLLQLKTVRTEPRRLPATKPQSPSRCGVRRLAFPGAIPGHVPAVRAPYSECLIHEADRMECRLLVVRIFSR
jgi:hypothetical protein